MSSKENLQSFIFLVFTPCFPLLFKDDDDDDGDDDDDDDDDYGMTLW